MGRRKLEMKRIEDKNSRQVTFSKRRTGLMKKARHLSVLCDVDIAVLVFSANGKLYKSCSGTSSNSVEHILTRYERSIAEVGERTNNGAGAQLEVLSQCTNCRTCKELLQTVDRLVKENNSEELSVTDMTELEQELDAALVQTRLRKYLMQLWNSYKMLDSGGMLHISPGRKMWILESWGYMSGYRDGDIGSLEPLIEAQKKFMMNKGKGHDRVDSSNMMNMTQLMIEYMSTLQEEEKKLTADKEELEKQVASAKQLQNDGGGGLNNLANNQTNSPQHLATLPLFNG